MVENYGNSNLSKEEEIIEKDNNIYRETLKGDLNNYERIIKAIHLTREEALSLQRQKNEFGKQEQLKGMEEHYREHLKYILASLQEKIKERVKLVIKLYNHKSGEELAGQINEEISKIFKEMGQ
jgi:hypothetical protein